VHSKDGSTLLSNLLWRTLCPLLYAANIHYVPLPLTCNNLHSVMSHHSISLLEEVSKLSDVVTGIHNSFSSISDAVSIAKSSIPSWSISINDSLKTPLCLKT
jgi:hypothetical protein